MIRTVRSFNFYRLVPAATTEEREYEGIMRDILPDKPYKIHYIDLTIRTDCEPADKARMGFGKNTEGDRVVSPDDILLAKSGLLFYAELAKEAATLVAESKKYSLNPQQPITMDKDDQLNIKFSHNNSHATVPKAVYYTFNIAYEG